MDDEEAKKDNEEAKKDHKRADGGDALPDGDDALPDGDEIGCFMQLIKAVWWVITLPFRIIGMALNSVGD